MDDQPKTLTPKLRFLEFRDEPAWETAQLDELAEFVSDRISAKQLSVSNYVSTENILPDFGGMTTAAKLPSTNGATKFIVDDILVSNIRPYLKKVWQADRDGGASNDVIVIRPKEGSLKRYLPIVLKSDAFISYVMTGAKGVKMPRGDIASIEKYPVYHPAEAEQRKVAACLTSLDELLAAEARKLEGLRAHKKGLMQQLFPREGESRPRLRFHEFRDAPEWSERTLGSEGEFLTSLSGKTAADFDTGQVRFIPYSNVFENTFINTDALRLVDVSSDENQNAVRQGDLFFTVSSETQADAGMASVLLEDIDSCYLNSFCTFFRFHNDRKLNSRFAGYLFRSQPVRSYLEANAQGAIRYNISRGVFRDLVFLAPGHAEQNTIADCLSSLDALIARQSRKLDGLRVHKKGLMQQLFPSPEGE